HNGETTNYEALKQRVEQFNLSPLATTDTEVASLKFHLTADAWEYPDWALFESFSPTTGDDLQLVEPEIRTQLEQVQRVEFASSPDGPYQYLCLRHNPYSRTTERVDLKDPADLRPNVSAFWMDKNGNENKVFSIIASEEHAVHRILELLDKQGIIDGSVADKTFSSRGMISRYRFEQGQQIQDYEFIDRYGRKIEVDAPGEHYSLRRQQLVEPSDTEQYQNWQSNYIEFFRDHLKDISFNDFRWLLHNMVENTTNDHAFAKHLEILTWLKDYLRTLNPGDKAQGSLIDIAQFYLNQLLDSARTERFENYTWIDQQGAEQFDRQPQHEQKLVIEASEFLAEGTDPGFSLTAFLAKAHRLGWRKFILYRTRGQRMISTAAMGNGDTDDVEMDVYGSVGEYFGAFMQGGTICLHGNAQNFCAMAMHHGELYVFGNAGKVCGYASKGGKVFIMGDIVDRCWTNSVNDSRTQDLEVMILGSATKYAGESLMGGNFFFGGLHFDNKGNLRLNERPYLGTKMLGGASRGNFVFFDPENRLVAAQYVHGVLKDFSNEEWEYLCGKIKESFELANITVHSENGADYIFIEDKKVKIAPENFKLVMPKGGLKGYESH
ncbi:MAG: hypothetical protein AMJ43_09490, partial [Coxiella sp. DG_40]